MYNSEVPFPPVRKISRLIDVLRDYAIGSVRDHCDQQTTNAYCAPSLASWGASDWFELTHDWDIVVFLMSGRDEANRLLKSLQACLQWYAEAEIKKILEQARLRHLIN